MWWYNHARVHDSLDRKSKETPAKAYVRKMPPNGETVIDEETGVKYYAW